MKSIFVPILILIFLAVIITSFIFGLYYEFDFQEYTNKEISNFMTTFFIIGIILGIQIYWSILYIYQELKKLKDGGI